MEFQEKHYHQLNILKDINIKNEKLLNLVQEVPLLRIYTSYKPNPKTNEVWFENLPKIVFKDGLKFFIPVHYPKEMRKPKQEVPLMISYTDGKFTNKMLNLFSKSPEDLEDYLHAEIEDKLNIKPTKATNLYFEYYSSGAHFGKRIAIVKTTMKIF